MAATEPEKTGAEIAAELAAADHELGEPLRIRQAVYRLQTGNYVRQTASELQNYISEQGKARGLTSILRDLSSQGKLDISSRVISTAEEKNNAQEQKLRAAIHEAEEKYGETEQFDAAVALAEFLAGTGQTEQAIEAYEAVNLNHTSVQQKTDLEMAKAMVALQAGQATAMKKYLDAAEALNEAGGDWDHRNRLKVYRAMYNILVRNFDDACHLLLDVVATYTCYEMGKYEEFTWYAVVLSLVVLPRRELQRKVLGAADLMAALPELPVCKTAVEALYECNYADFMANIPALAEEIAGSRLLGPHLTYYLKQLRIKVYSQFLEAYKSVTLQNMASVFGVSPQFIDAELSKFIALGALPAKIDSIHGVVQSTRAAPKHAAILEVLKEGDAVLANLQKLARVMHV